jgi:hypothetical protein
LLKWKEKGGIEKEMGRCFLSFEEQVLIME